jgi:hypothetical protein
LHPFYQRHPWPIINHKVQKAGTKIHKEHKIKPKRHQEHSSFCSAFYVLKCLLWF